MECMEGENPNLGWEGEPESMLEGIRGSLLLGEELGLIPSFPGASGGWGWAGGAERWPCG